MPVTDFSSLPIRQLIAELQSSESGLSASTAKKRLRKNNKSTPRQNIVKKGVRLFLNQFINPLVGLLLIAVILSAIAGEAADSVIILTILLLTGTLGFWQEFNAGRAMESLQKMIELRHSVLRSGQLEQLLPEEIADGDILVLDAGDLIPADCRIMESNELHVNESSLTGESFPVEKFAGVAREDLPLNKKFNCLWQGTNIISGTATAIVVRSGTRTIFGRMSRSLLQLHETAFEKGIKAFGYFLLRITVVLAILILLTNLYFKKPLFDSVLFSLALAVGMAPELLPAIMTFAMAQAAKRMVRKKVIVKKLSSIFNFGEVNVLCTDKTGTITEGNVTVKDVVDINGVSSDRLKVYAFLNATLQKGFSNPIDEAIAALNLTAEKYKKTDEIPYDFTRKCLSIAVKYNGEFIFITKGAFSSLLNLCNFTREGDQIEPLSAARRKALFEKYVAYSREGYRVLGLAVKQIASGDISREDEKDMEFLGYILLEDPLKESALTSINRLEELDVTVKIITGDNRYAAAHNAEKIGLKDVEILTAEDIQKLSPEALVIKARHTAIFAEIEPQQKERIVLALQKSNLVVAYVGDGINDVAAINAADIGISTSNAADVTKAAADFVLLEKDLSVIADGIYEGRKSFANSMKYILITTGATFGNMISIAAASLFLPFLPMLPKQILLTNLITDLPFLSIASDHVDDEDLKQPGKWNLSMIRRFMIVFGLHSSFFDLLTFYILYFHFKLSISSFQTGWFIESTVSELMILLIIRTKKSFIRSRPGKFLFITTLSSFCISIFLPFSPFSEILGLSATDLRPLLTIVAVLAAYMVSADVLKIIFFRLAGKPARS